MFDVFVVGFGELMVDVCGFMMKIFMVVEIWFGGCYILVFILEEEGIVFFFLLNKYFLNYIFYVYRN